MPRPICVACNREMRMVQAVTAQLNAIATKGPYQQWQGDLAHCDGCGVEVVVRFALQPSWEHYMGADSPKRSDPYVVVEERRGS